MPGTWMCPCGKIRRGALLRSRLRSPYSEKNANFFRACNHCSLQVVIITLNPLLASMMIARPTLCTYPILARRFASRTPRLLGTITSPVTHARRQRSNEAWISFRAHRPHKTSQYLENHRLYRRGRRRLSSSSIAMHGHLTPPRLGEE